MVNVVLFGMIKDITGSNSILLNGVNDTNELIHKLHSMFPPLTEAKYLVAVNRNVIQENTALEENAEVALLPPYSGG